jgi:hypothetical protein
MPNVAIAVSTSGDNQLIAGVAGKTIRVMGYIVTAAAAVAVKFRSNATDLTGPMNLPLNGSISAFAAANDDALFDCAPGDPLVLNLSGAVAVNGHLRYTVLN